MDKVTKMSMLIDFYGKLLTPKQYNIIDLYYNNDYSLSEIAENLNISRQSVHDSLKRAEEILCSYEDNLGLVNKFILQNQSLKSVLENLNNIEINELENKKYKENILQSIDMIESLINNNEL